MPNSIEDPRVTFLNLIESNWTPGNVLSTTPDFHTGWLNQDNANPQITFNDPFEVSQGESGWAATDGGGAGPVALVTGTLVLNCWAQRSVDDGSAPNPKKLTDLMRKEIERIIQANAGTVTDLLSVGVQSSTSPPPDLERYPTWFLWSVTIVYKWLRTPA